MDAKTFIETAKTLPVDLAVLARGPHGIGKSQIIGRTLAQHFELPLIDIRLSQREAGDVIGLPLLENGTTKFCPPDWVMRACREPVILFLDELNRATPEVQQAVFELVLDRRMAGHQLHAGTRVYAAVNLSGNYQVNEMDPALLDRFYVCDLEPTPEETLAHFKNIGFNDDVITFLRDRPARLDPSPKVDSSKVQPSRRSWERFDVAARKNGFYDADVQEDQSVQGKIFNLALGLLGTEVASSLVDHLVRSNQTIKAEDVLNNFKKIEAKVKKASIDRTNDLIDRLLTHGAKNAWTPAQLDNLGDFIDIVDPELRVSFVLGMMQPSFARTATGMANLKGANRAAMAVVESFKSKSIDEDKIKKFAEDRAAKALKAAEEEAAKAAAAPAPAKRGRKPKSATVANTPAQEDESEDDDV